MKFLSLSCIACIVVSIQACLLPEEIEGKPRKINRRQTSNGVPIGSGDRYAGGTIAPRGVGTQSTTFTSILSTAEIASGLKGLATVYGINAFSTPYPTYQGRTISGGRVGGSGTCTNAFRIFLEAGIHARERGGPDGLLFFIGDLLYANRTGTGLTFGSRTYTNAQVKTALSAGIVFLPLVNPDGVAYDQSSNSCWRKNRNPASSTGSAASIGIDLNRNLDFLWNFPKYFARRVRTDSLASNSPEDETFHGTAAFSEPETKSIKWILDTYAKVRWFLDLHSFAGDVLYSWGDDQSQTTTTAQSFNNSAFDSIRGITTDTAYKEYVKPAEFSAIQAVASRVGQASSAAAGRTYAVMQSSELYPTSGSTTDYVYGRHLVNSALNIVRGFTIEFGFGNEASSCPFYPTQSQHTANLKEIEAGFMEFVLAAVANGLGDATVC
ncbi:related to carboxypeptidase A [Rhynchosporium agropyri]|uniref:Related to carboxypeptidase A n=2 Tax=Rhynchosporium TaxID=38037 RepID=A0A1E1LKP6_9HELO|nr:related to carboxypeptidase A [Rhynchosporium agropyri]CZT12848.1 related to carboxypeptidase A [Rhynchosporium commune]